MADDFTIFTNHWVYDIRRSLERHLDTLKDDLASDDKSTRELAENEASEILDWLYLPPPPLSDEERGRLFMEVNQDASLSSDQKATALRRLLHPTGRKRGRPRTETAQHAIRALSMHLAGLDWRVIALEVRGCNHFDRTTERSCHCCGDAIRDAAGRLEKYLRNKGYYPDFPQCGRNDCTRAPPRR